MVQRGEDARLAPEICIHVHVGAQTLDGHGALQVLIPGAEYLAGAARADGILNQVARRGFGLLAHLQATL